MTGWWAPPSAKPASWCADDGACARSSSWTRAPGTAVVQAGVPADAAEQADAQGWMFPVDIGSRGSCQVGGLIATNAGGNRVLRFGMMRQQVLGLEVVLPDGRVVSRMGAPLKDNAGYDLKHGFIGSEGTLGVITRPAWRCSRAR